MRFSFAASQLTLLIITIARLDTLSLVYGFVQPSKPACVTTPSLSPRTSFVSKTLYIENKSNQNVIFMAANNAIEEKSISSDGNTEILIPASNIRSAEVTNVDGEIITLGEKMGKGTSLVIFLRHLG